MSPKTAESSPLREPHLTELALKLSQKQARIGVLLGGMSTERGVSLKSGAAVAKALRARGWEVAEIDVGPDLPFRLREERIDLAWLALHGRFGEDGCVQGLLEIMRIPYTGSGVRPSAIAMDKVSTKRALRDIGVRLVPDRVWRQGEDIPENLPRPLSVKTPQGGSTLGIRRVENPGDLESALCELGPLDAEVLIEHFVAGEEITVAVLHGRALPVVAIRPKDPDHFFDFEAKYTDGKTEYLVPAPISATAAADATRQALLAYATLGLSGVARADFIVDSQDQAWFLEVNTLPGMTATSLSPMAAREVGLSFEDLVESLLLAARLHVQREDPAAVAAPGKTPAPTFG